ncbi:MAG: hypothetical protein JW811_01410 [Clostridiales bacterium]|nr:hypothetical protein [Clostridiales bacterium]
MSFSIKPMEQNGGYGISVEYGGKSYFQESTGFVFENADRSIRETIGQWLADAWEPIPGGVLLKGTYASPNFETRLELSVTYTAVNDRVVKKVLTLHQPNIPVLFYSAENTLRPVKSPQKLWSFDNADHRGGLVHGTYPAIGFTDGVSFGLLSDAGHRNLFTRNIRRRPGPREGAFTGMLRTADAKMLTLSPEAITLRLGCMSDYAQGEKHALAEQDHDFGELFHAYPGEDGFYTLSFDYQADAPLHIKILKETPQSEIRAFHYQDNIEFDPGVYKHYQDTFFLSDTEGLPTLVKLWQGEDGLPKLRNLRLIRHEGVDLPYHPLKIGQTHTKTTFIFAEAGDDIRSLRLSSQLCLAEGLGFKGSDPQKVLYADMQMLTWITGEHDFTPLNIPSINYAPDMYNRDSFWSVAGVKDAPLSKAVFDRWGDTQTPEGGIGTIVTPFMGSLEVKDNEATCEWLWWALINREKYGFDPPQGKIALAFEYCKRNFDPDHSGICRAHFVLGQNDVTTYPDEPTTDLAVNQGVWAVTLKVAKALGLHDDEAWITRAVDGYRAFYDETRGYVLNDRLHPYVVSCNDMLPEFTSLWLFDEPMLDDEMVIGTVEKIPRNGPFAFIIGHVEEGYFTNESKPYDGHFFWPGGVYYNGASWMREEVMAYAAGVRHGWTKGRQCILDRLQAEIDVKPDEPFSHEFIPTDPSVPGCWWPSIRVFCWNVFALTACDVAGI